MLILITGGVGLIESQLPAKFFKLNYEILTPNGFLHQDKYDKVNQIHKSTWNYNINSTLWDKLPKNSVVISN